MVRRSTSIRSRARSKSRTQRERSDAFAVATAQPQQQSSSHLQSQKQSLPLLESLCLLSILTGSVSVMVLCFRLLPTAVSTASIYTHRETIAWATTRTPEFPLHADLLMPPPLPQLQGQHQHHHSRSGAIPCRYDGTCPKRMICDATIITNAKGENVNTNISEEESPPGVCRPWTITPSPLPSLATCVDACLEELTQDEHFYQHYWPAVLEAYSIHNGGTPQACGIVYKRSKDFALKWTKQDDRNDGRELGPAVQKWIHDRFRHLARVDSFTDDLNDNRWVALCKAPCESDRDCQTPLEAKIWSYKKNDENLHKQQRQQQQAYACDAGACRKNIGYWEESTDESRMDLVIVTAASGDYFDALCNLAASIRYWEPEIQLVVYNLGGFSAAQIAQIDSWENVSLQWRDEGIPQYYPDHVHRLDTFAWRPIIIHDSLLTYKSMLFLEAGSALTGPLDAVQDVLEREGIFLVHSHTDMMQSHPDMYHWFGTEKEGYPPKTPHFLGRVQGHLYPSRYYDTVVRPNALCALDAACITPSAPVSNDDSNNSNINNSKDKNHLNRHHQRNNNNMHHTDQTSLSILAHHQKMRVPHHNEYLAEVATELNEDLSRPSKRIIWGKQRGNFYSKLEKQQQQQ